VIKERRGIAILVFYALCVAFFSLQPAGGTSIGSYDKLAHFVTYGIFAVLAHRVNLSGRDYILLCIGIVAYSGLLEVGQSFVPGRNMSALDLLANTLGVLLTALLCKKMFANG
jgi:VanZ family protein